MLTITRALPRLVERGFEPGHPLWRVLASQYRYSVTVKVVNLFGG
jgi:hypothetical protein